MQGIAIAKRGIGDAIQFSSLPENYFKACGEKLIDIDKCWIFDHNPFVSRETDVIPTKITQLWNFGHPDIFEWPNPRIELPQKGDRNPVPARPKVYLSNAEIWASHFKVPVILNRPRLYIHEDYPFEQREMILIQTEGRSHGTMPKHIMNHIVEKYNKTGKLFHVGPGDQYGLSHIETPEIWDIVELISKARMFIGVDSGLGWISCCYSDVITKIVRTKPLPNLLEKWIPLEQNNLHSFWDSRERIVYNPTENDIGFTWSYKRI